MSLGAGYDDVGRLRLPRRCGDVPLPLASISQPGLVAPQVRGCPHQAVIHASRHHGCPAGAGMSPINPVFNLVGMRLPRRCGDVPFPATTPTADSWVAPQVRGCPRRGNCPLVRQAGCPAGAGMSPGMGAAAFSRVRLPRRCGDVPGQCAVIGVGNEVAPQVRGCPPRVCGGTTVHMGCPAGAGMSRRPRSFTSMTGWLPRRCGDVPCCSGRCCRP